MSGDLISREGLEKALSELGRMYIDGIADDKAYVSEQRVYEVLRNAPTVEAESVVHAHWVMRGGRRYCSACGTMACVTRDRDDFWYTVGTKRCPECGAHMDEEVAG
jgi:hypothetical protein